MKDVHELEIYAPIKGYTDYLVTSHGRVISLRDNHGKYRLKELKLIITRGYLYVNLHKNGKIFFKTVHRLVAQAFIPNPENKPQVNHIDEDKTNNHVSNLEWMTARENVNHGTRNERASKILSDGRLKGENHHMYGKKLSEEHKRKLSNSHKGKKHTNESKRKMSLNHANYKGNNNPKAKSVVGFKINGCNIKYYNYIKESEKDGFNPKCISDCCCNRQKSHKGYVWFYTDEFFNKNK